MLTLILVGGAGGRVNIIVDRHTMNIAYSILPYFVTIYVIVSTLTRLSA